MNHIFEMIKTPEFWICTIFLGFWWGVGQNLASHFIIKFFPNLLSKISEKLATRTIKLTTERNARIAKLINNPQEQNYVMSRAILALGDAILMFLLVAVLSGFQIMGFVVMSMQVTIAATTHTTFAKFPTGWHTFMIFIGIFALLAFNKIMQVSSMVLEVKVARKLGKQDQD